MENETEFVNVAIRIKPVSYIKNECLQVISKEPPVLLLPDRAQTFTFDNIFTEETSQESIFNDTVKPLVQYVKEGYNCTVFAYGQTGTGKTYTMGTNDSVKKQDNGLISRTLDHFLFSNSDDAEVDISLSFIEIYNEKVFDLLQNHNKPPLQVKGLKAHGFSRERIFSLYEASHFLNMGNKNRHTTGTKQNSQSSRSHAIFTIYCNVKYRDKETTAKLNLVDLAGSESVKRTGNSGTTFQEGININKGLLSIGQVMTALSNNNSFIPYRQSVITSILQDSLNKNNFVCLIACVSPLVEDTIETVQTLEFAQRVKKMKSKPEANEVVTKFKKENPSLFQIRTNTPFKRPVCIQTPKPFNSKKPKLLSILESNYSATSSIDQSNSPKSLGVASSISSTAHSSISLDVTNQPLSPVIRKYMNAMESSLMDKLGLVIKSTLKRPHNKNEVIGTPHVPWDLIQNEVSKIVKSEIAQLTSNTVRATSSPVEKQLEDVRKILNYDDSPISNIAESSSNKENEFKVPIIPIKKMFNKRHSLALSPIENIKIRRSVRLSLKRKSQCGLNTNITTLGDVELSTNSSYLVNESNIKQEGYKTDLTKYFECSKRTPSFNLRSKRSKTCTGCSCVGNKTINESKHKLNVLETPAAKRLLKGKQKDSPFTLHTKEVLHTINNGNTKDLEKLHMIGPKSAQQITLFRDIKGKITTLSDLKKMPGWGSKKFDKFVEQNFLKKQLI